MKPREAILGVGEVITMASILGHFAKCEDDGRAKVKPPLFWDVARAMSPPPLVTHAEICRDFF